MSQLAIDELTTHPVDWLYWNNGNLFE